MPAKAAKNETWVGDPGPVNIFLVRSLVVAGNTAEAYNVSKSLV